MKGGRAAAVLCAAEVLGMLGFASFQALVPEFAALWGLTNVEIGWVSGGYFVGYVAAVPVLVAATDRIDARTVFLGATAVGGIAQIGFALAADGFATALAWRALAGAALAGAYMPGLKALADRAAGETQSRHIAFYTSSFGIGVALSFWLTGVAADAFGWRWAVGGAALGAAASCALIAIGLTPVRPTPPARATPLLDFRPILRNRRVMAFVLGYFGHCWELFAFRAWIVAFLAYAAARHAPGALVLAPTEIAALANLLGVPASIFGNELAVRMGRIRLIALVAALSVAASLVIGAAALWAPWLVLGLALLYGVLVAGDSAALTAGAVAAAEEGRRGATLAAHGFLGFVGGVIGPPAAGLALDLAGGADGDGWIAGFAAMGAGSAIALLGLALARRGGRGGRGER